MNYKNSVVSLIHQKMSLSPDRSFSITGFVKMIDRELKKTVLEIHTCDREKMEDNTDKFFVTFYGDMKSMADKIVNRGDLVVVNGHINTNHVTNVMQLEGRHLMAFDGVKNVFDHNVPARELRDAIDDPSLLY